MVLVLVVQIGKNVGNAAVLAGNSSVMTEKSNTDWGRFQTKKHCGIVCSNLYNICCYLRGNIIEIY